MALKFLIISLLILLLTSITYAEPKLTVNRSIGINDNLKYTNVLDLTHRGHKDSYSISSVSSLSLTLTSTVLLNLRYKMKSDYLLFDKPSDSISQAIISTINFHF